MTGSLSQKFRTFTPPGLSPAAPIVIDTHQDPKTGQRFTLWRDIQLVFKNVQYIKNGRALVSFMTDEDFEDLVPCRIIHHPGVILDVVIGPEQPSNNSTRPTIVPQVSSLSPTSTTSTLFDHSTDPMAAMNMDRLALTSSNSPTHRQRGDSSATTMPVEFVRALHDELDSNRAFRAEVGIEILHNRVFRAEITDSVQQVNNRLAILQKRIESLITQTYELHEYPIPRLFIVLPKIATRRRDNLSPKKSFIKQFRLYFLCECGDHTRTEGSKISHEIHLAKHEGYDLDRPTEFFEKYGSYVLTIMEMIKIGYSLAGIIVPALGHFKLAEGINSAQKSLDFPQSAVGALVDDMIKYIQDQQNGPDDDGSGKTKDNVRHGLDHAEVLEGADLRLLQSYLGIKDQGRALGNLYRMVTQEGHVKWVCMNHYRENYRASIMQRLRDTVEANNGSYNEEFGRIEIRLSSTAVAKQFYETIVQARGVQELEVTLAWDVTLEDLRSFALAMSTASIVNLTINGQAFKGPSRDFINSSRRFDPILGLMFNSRIQSLRVDNCEEFYHRIGNPSVAASPLLRVLHLDPKLLSKDKAAVLILRKILDKSPLLTDLTVRSDDIAFVQDLIAKSYPNHKLERLCLMFLDSTISLQFSQGTIQDVKADLKSMDDLFSQPNFETKGLITTLRVKNTSIGSIHPIERVLKCNKNLSEIEITGQAGMFNDFIRGITKARNGLKSQGITTALRQLRLQTIDSSNTDRHRERQQSDKVTMTIDFCDHSVDVSSAANVEMRSSLLTDLFEHQGSCIQTLTTNRTFDDRHAAALHKSTARGCNIKTLKLDLTSLSEKGLNSVDTIIRRSKDLENLVMEFQDLADRPQQAKVVRSLILHGNLLYGLRLRGEQEDARWLVEIANTLPNRSYLSKLRSFHVMCQAAYIPNSCASWLAAMLQGPPNLSSSFSSLSSSSSSLIAHSPTSSTISRRMSSWTSLTDIRIEYIVISPENWVLIIKAIDFSELENLSFEHSNFGFEQLALLVECLPDHDEADVPLKALHVKHTPLQSFKAQLDDHLPAGGSNTNSMNLSRTFENLQELEARFEEKAPLAQIKDLWSKQS